eukprot:5145978-Pleurochrysis_carterae.AAC.1
MELTPRSLMIQRLQAEKAAERARAATPGTTRALTFGDAEGPTTLTTTGQRAAEGTPDGEPAPRRRRLGEPDANAFEGLRPAGEEGAGTARVMKELDTLMGGEGSMSK